MQKPIVIAHHLSWTAYGWWLPNDPRGSGSTTIRSDVIAELGELHFGRKRVQPAGRVVRDFYNQADEVLKYSLLTFEAAARDTIAAAFAEVIRNERYTCYACAVLPDHVHILIRKHKHHGEEMADLLKARSMERLRSAVTAFAEHPVWARGHGWGVFLDHPDDVRRTIGYIERNPLRG